jgi:hypothetical protein
MTWNWTEGQGSSSGRRAVASLAMWTVSILLGWAGCAKPTEGTTLGTAGTTGGPGGAGGGGMGGASGGAGGTTGVGGVPESCTQGSDCAALDVGCMVGACQDGKCVTIVGNDFMPCQDGSACTTGDYCVLGECKGIAKDCGEAPPCKVMVCSPATGQCNPMPAANGSICDDGNPCTGFGTCSNGTCGQGLPIDCTFLDSDCSIGVCDPASGCMLQPMSEGFACDDDLYCTINETCVNGTCTAGAPLPCAPGGCFAGVCDEVNDTCVFVPGNDGAPCDDGSPCTSNTTCANGGCVNGTPANDGLTCDDGVACTAGETCSSGACAGGVGPQIFLAEDFSDNTAGWLLDPEWQIGPAKQGVSSGFGFPDPELDHTPTADDGVAGVVIGGDASTLAHGYYYLESPPFDTSGAAGPVVLGYHRWLNSDSDPAMHNEIQVWDGVQWVTVWASNVMLFETSWTFQQLDLTSYKNPAMRIRFGFDVTDLAFGSFSSWNVDDVLVASQACP